MEITVDAFTELLDNNYIVLSRNRLTQNQPKMDIQQQAIKEYFNPGDISLFPAGHDAWTVGDEPAVVIDFQGMIDFAKHH